MNGRRPMRLVDLVDASGLREADIRGNPNAIVTGISTHARKTGRNEMFVAITGTTVDSHMLLSEAVEAGAAALLVEKETPPYPGVTTVRVPNTRQALGHLAHAFHNHPTKAMKVCGVTGTNGKTTVAHIIYHILRAAGARAGMIGTLGAFYDDRSIDGGNTTPDPVSLAAILAQMERANVETVVTEVSSHGVDQGRINGIRFRAGALTNVTHDHLDYHGDFQSYANCKKRFFFDYVAPTPGSVASFNLDDPIGREMQRIYTEDSLSYSAEGTPGAMISAENVRFRPAGVEFTLAFGGVRLAANCPLAGRFNLANILAAVACCHTLGVGLRDIVEGLAVMPPVPGRFEYIDEGQPFTVLVDYAHTSDALERLLRSARRVCIGKLITVFGCGGDRDRAKRPIMGRVAGDNSDFVVVTNDNPRTEDPEQIARHAVQGILQSALKSNRFQVILDRAQAIEQAISLAAPNDVVVIAGKGHEDYQLVGGMSFNFDDRAVARQILRALPAANGSPVVELQTIQEKLA